MTPDLAAAIARQKEWLAFLDFLAGQYPGDAQVIQRRDDLRKIIDALKGATWRPIESAPKDGTRILVWRRDAGEPFVAYYGTASRYVYDDDEEERWWSESGEDLSAAELLPTRWQPLPAPPVELPAAERTTP